MNRRMKLRSEKNQIPPHPNISSILRQPFPRMPPSQNQNSQDNRRELQSAEKRLVGARIAAHSIRRLSQAENRTQIDQQATHDDSAAELHQAAAAAGGGGRGRFASIGQKHKEEDEKKQKRKDLIRQASKQNIIARVGSLIITFRHADQRRAGDLGNSGNDIARNKKRKNKRALEAEGTEMLA